MTYSNFIKFYLKVLIFAVFFLIFWGALVKSHNAGLSVPDWPTTYGYNMFAYPVSRWKGGIFYEHLHRLIASLIGALTVVMAVVLTLKKEKRNIVLLSWLSVFLVSVQGVLGGLTVIYRLPVLISSAHGVLAQTFLLVLILIYFLITNKEKLLNFANK
ncbi:MAG: cytochrome oxidase biogenesis protein CtaA, partial [Candidatus Dadabacteria bacterium]